MSARRAVLNAQRELCKKTGLNLASAMSLTAESPGLGVLAKKLFADSPGAAGNTPEPQTHPPPPSCEKDKKGKKEKKEKKERKQNHAEKTQGEHVQRGAMAIVEQEAPAQVAQATALEPFAPATAQEPAAATPAPPLAAAPPHTATESRSTQQEALQKKHKKDKKDKKREEGEEGCSNPRKGSKDSGSNCGANNVGNI